MKRFRRTTIIVEKRLQLDLLASALGYVVFLTVVVATALFLPLMRDLKQQDPSSIDALSTATATLYIHARFWPAVLLTMVVISLHSILTSHRIAGPLYRLRTILAGISKGSIPKRFRTRPKDYFQLEIRSANEMIDSLRRNIVDLGQASEALRRTICEAKSSLPGASHEDVAALVEELQRQGACIEAKLAFYKIES